MKLTAKLAYSQLMVNRKRTIWTLFGIILSTVMISSVYNFLASAYEMFTRDMDETYYVIGTHTITFIVIGIIIGLIVVAVSVNVVSNAFRISADERVTQFGALKSVGATKQQITQVVIYEGLMLSIVGIPIGVVLGVAATFINVNIANHFLSTWNNIDNFGSALVFDFIVAWQAITISVAVAFVTVLLSAWIPARKASKISAIDLVRGSGVVKLKVEQVHSNPIVQKLFGFEGMLAYKSLKRNNRNFRASVISITISVILFTVVSSVGTQINSMMMNLIFPNIDASATVHVMTDLQISFDESGDIYFLYNPIETDMAEEMTSRLREFPNANLMGVGGLYNARANIPKEMISPDMVSVIGDPYDDESHNVSAWLLSIDSQTYAELAEKAGVPIGSNILVNFFRHNVHAESSYIPYIFDNQTVHIETINGYVKEVELHGELTEVPDELLNGFTGANSELIVIVPRLGATYFNWFANPEDLEGFLEHANEVVSDLDLIPRDGDVEMFVNVTDIRKATEAIQGIINLIKIFLYGFIGMLTLIGLTNIISTISTNVRSRSKEFAVLRSVGMTHKGLDRMLNLESALCSAKSLIWGLPIGSGISFIIYRFVMHSMGVDYHFPWLTMLYSILGVFAITWITMRYSVLQVRGGSIVEKIRKGGMSI